MGGIPRLAPGALFAGDLEIRKQLAEGGMGTVYAVLDRTCGEERALKVLLPELVADETSRRRFAQEARIGADIDSPHVPRMHRAGVDDGTGIPYIVMDLLRGRDLRAYVRARGALPVEEARPILEQLGGVLAVAHARGLVHRDLKPENVFLEDTGGTPRVMLLDFGVAKIIDVRRSSATGTGAIGSPMWMAPEQTTVGGRIAPSTDVYALGLLVFYVLTGRMFWRAAHDHSGVGGLMREMHVDEPTPASMRALELAPELRLPAGLDEWFARAVVRAPAERFRDAGEALAALRPVLAPAAHPVDRSGLAFAQTLEVQPSQLRAQLDETPTVRDPPLAPPPAVVVSAPQPVLRREPTLSVRPEPARAEVVRAAPAEVVRAAPDPTLEVVRRHWPWLLALAVAAFFAAVLLGLILFVVLTIAKDG